MIKGAPTGGISYHSKNEQSPWVMIDLGAIRNIAHIKIYNRGDKHYYRALSLMIETSDNLASWETCYNNLSYRESSEYHKLSNHDKALCDLASLQAGSAINIRNDLLKIGEKEQAINFQEVANEVLTKHRLSIVPHGLTQTFSVQTEKQIGAVYSELSRFLKILNEEMGVSAFASSGTLLGFVRDGGLLVHDDDIDLCYISKQSSKEGILAERTHIINTLREKGYGVNPSNGAHLWISAKYEIAMDLFTGWESEGRCIMNPLLNSGVTASDIFPLKVETIHDVKIYMPNNPESLMELNYGQNWRKPDPIWKFNWSHARSQYGFLYFD